MERSPTNGLGCGSWSENVPEGRTFGLTGECKHGMIMAEELEDLNQEIVSSNIIARNTEMLTKMTRNRFVLLML